MKTRRFAFVNILGMGSSSPSLPNRVIGSFIVTAVLAIALIWHAPYAMGQPPSTLDWTLATDDAAWTPRRDHTSVAYDGRMWVIGSAGGAGFGSLGNDVWYSSDGVAWTTATLEAQWSERSDHTSVVFENRMWVIGGISADAPDNIGADVWHSEDGADWTAATLSAPWEGRFGHTSVVFDGKIWVIGGQTVSGASSEVWSSSDGADWELVTDTPEWWRPDLSEYGTGRSEHTSVVFDGRIWVIGGYEGDQFFDLVHHPTDVWSSADGVTWTLATSTAPWGERTQHRSVVFAGKMWVLGRQSVLGSFPTTNDAWFSSDGVTWFEATSRAVWSPRGGQTSVVFDDKMWVIGGARGVSDVWFTSAPVNGVLNWRGYP